MSKLVKAGFAGDEATRLASMAQETPNLQLLTPMENESKSGRFPGAWLESTFPDVASSGAIRAIHHLGQAGNDLHGFERFYEERSVRLARVIRAKLGVAEPSSALAALPATTFSRDAPDGSD